ncbi:MAG: HAMP domain-containing histidine kinase [Chlorobi bacterium]|nr:HAMP domain-containing histidine kinase [Chlorobiota bacterium]
MSWLPNPDKIWYKYRRLFLLAVLLATVGVILWNSYILFRHIKEQERVKMELWADAVQKIISSPLNADVSLPLKIVSKNTDIPVIMTDSTGKIIETYNLDRIKEDSLRLYKQLARFKKQNDPLEVDLPSGKQWIYYGNSRIFNVLTWYPLTLILIFGLFLLVGYLYYYTSRVSEQNLLWAGMAKEAAHQIGTPLTSLIGWTELMKTDPASVPVEELQKDIYRLEIISRRFSKIGSRPKLYPAEINEEIQKAVQYLKSRIPGNVRVMFTPSQRPLYASLNPELFQWVIENLVKNAVDAMPQGGSIRINVTENGKDILIDVADEGTGISKKNRNKIFRAGFSTKTRGWGLGLSVVKRIIKDMHKGHIFVKESIPGKGTVFRIKLKKTHHEDHR